MSESMFVVGARVVAKGSGLHGVVERVAEGSPELPIFVRFDGTGSSANFRPRELEPELEAMSRPMVGIDLAKGSDETRVVALRASEVTLTTEREVEEYFGAGSFGCEATRSIVRKGEKVVIVGSTRRVGLQGFFQQQVKKMHADFDERVDHAANSLYGKTSHRAGTFRGARGGEKAIEPDSVRFGEPARMVPDNVVDQLRANLAEAERQLAQTRRVMAAKDENWVGQLEAERKKVAELGEERDEAVRRLRHDKSLMNLRDRLGGLQHELSVAERERDRALVENSRLRHRIDEFERKGKAKR